MRRGIRKYGVVTRRVAGPSRPALVLYTRVSAIAPDPRCSFSPCGPSCRATTGIVDRALRGCCAPSRVITKLNDGSSKTSMISVVTICERFLRGTTSGPSGDPGLVLILAYRRRESKVGNVAKL